MANTIVGVYDNIKDAQSALKELMDAGFEIEHVRLSPEDETFDARQQALRYDQDHGKQGGVGHFFRTMFGSPSQDRDRHSGLYSEAVRRGSFLLTVHAASEEQSERASAILTRYHPVDIEDRATLWQAEGWSGYDRDASAYDDRQVQHERSRLGSPHSSGAAAASNTTSTKGSREQMALPVIREELHVGKREIQRGGVRIYQHVTETPVQETVHLREEHVSVERHKVDQPASPEAIAALKEGTFEMRESAEEAVVAKTARVIEEVVIGKTVTERDETISDSVRRSDVEVEKMGGEVRGEARSAASGAGPTAALEEQYRSHWSNTYGAASGRYEDYVPAYHYGAELADQERYRDHRFSDVERDIERDWGSSHAGHPWARVKDAVRYGWEHKAH